MQLTYNTVNTAGPVYQSFIAGGYIFYFGNVSNIVPTITLSPTPTKIIIAIAQANTMTTAGTPAPFNCSTTVTQPDKIKINSSIPNSPYSFSWMAIATV